MKRRMRHVLPTAPSPTRQILTFILWRSIDILTGGSSRPPALGYKGIAQRLSSRITGRFFAWRSGSRLGIGTVSYRIGERLERFVDAGPGLRGREEGGRVVDGAHPQRDHLPRVREDRGRRQRSVQGARRCDRTPCRCLNVDPIATQRTSLLSEKITVEQFLYNLRPVGATSPQ